MFNSFHLGYLFADMMKRNRFGVGGRSTPPCNSSKVDDCSSYNNGDQNGYTERDCNGSYMIDEDGKKYNCHFYRAGGRGCEKKDECSCSTSSLHRESIRTGAHGEYHWAPWSEECCPGYQINLQSCHYDYDIGHGGDSETCRCEKISSE